MFYFRVADSNNRTIIDIYYSMILFYILVSYDVAPGSEIIPCNKVDKPLAVYRFSGNVMTTITKLRKCTYLIKLIRFYGRNELST